MVSRWQSVCPSVVLPVRISFPDYTLSKEQWIFSNFCMFIESEEICFWIVNGWWSIIDKLSARQTSVFSFPDDNLSKCQRIFTKLGMCIDIVEICFGIAYVQISSIDSYLPATYPYFRIRMIFSKYLV